MKKSLVIALALVFVLGIAGTAFAAANPFVDVPAKHWAYDAVNKLYKAGVVEGAAGKYMGDKNLTRYEMAQIIARAMSKADKADAETKAIIDKLQVEFAAELNNLGVRVAKLEKNASSIKFSGDARFRYTSNFSADTLQGDAYPKSPDRTQLRARIKMVANPADNVEFTGRISTQERLMDASKSDQNDQTEFDIMQFAFKDVMGTTVTLGRQYGWMGQGLLFDAPYFDAAKVAFGNEVKVWVAYGDVAYSPGPTTDNVKNTGANAKMIKAMNVSYDASKNLNLSAAAIYSATKGYNVEVASFGTTYKFANDYAFTGEYAKNNHDNATTDNSAYWTKLAYKGATWSNVGSWGVYVDYRKLGVNSGVDGFTTLNNNIGSYNGHATGIKGMGFGTSYTVAKNSIFFAEVENYKSTDAAEVKFAPFYNVRLQWVF